MSSVIKNLDKSFSIIRVEERLPEQYSEFRKSLYSNRVFVDKRKIKTSPKRRC